MRVVAFEGGEEGVGDRVGGVAGECRGRVEIFHCCLYNINIAFLKCGGRESDSSVSSS